MTDLAKDYTIKKWFKDLWTNRKIILGSTKTELEPKSQRNHHLNFGGMSLAWIILLYLRGGDTIKDAWYVLFTVDKSYIQDDTILYTKTQIWQIHNGLWTLMGLTIFSVFFIIHLIGLIRINRKLKKIEQDA